MLSKFNTASPQHYIKGEELIYCRKGFEFVSSTGISYFFKHKGRIRSREQAKMQEWELVVKEESKHREDSQCTSLLVTYQFFQVIRLFHCLRNKMLKVLKGDRSHYFRQFCLILSIMSSKRQIGREGVFHLQNQGHITTENDFPAV